MPIPQTFDEAFARVKERVRTFQENEAFYTGTAYQEAEARKSTTHYCVSAFFVEAGGLMAWAPDQEGQYRIAARYVDKILKGAKPGDLPASYPGRYYLSINRSAARAIGLSLPAGLVAKADRLLP
jgi:putative tryptophan/tyrosine transport system substrate-binding protein